jgi:hypothetical protein
MITFKALNLMISMNGFLYMKTHETQIIICSFILSAYNKLSWTTVAENNI